MTPEPSEFCERWPRKNRSHMARNWGRSHSGLCAAREKTLTTAGAARVTASAKLSASGSTLATSSLASYHSRAKPMAAPMASGKPT